MQYLTLNSLIITEKGNSTKLYFIFFNLEFIKM